MWTTLTPATRSPPSTWLQARSCPATVSQRLDPRRTAQCRERLARPATALPKQLSDLQLSVRKPAAPPLRPRSVARRLVAHISSHHALCQGHRSRHKPSSPTNPMDRYEVLAHECGSPDLGACADTGASLWWRRAWASSLWAGNSALPRAACLTLWTTSIAPPR